MLYRDHMMLQREKPLTVTGLAENAGTVTLLLYQDPAKATPEATHAFPISVTGDVHDGHFSCLLPPLPAARGIILECYIDKEKEPAYIIRDINIGDIWMACGQSNMEYFLRYDADWNYTKAEPVNKQIRMFNVPRISFSGQEKPNIGCGFWFEEKDEAWQYFSAPGHAFASFIQPEIDVPVGIIGCNWGGTPACAWMKPSYYENEPLAIFNREYEQAVALFDPEELRRQSMEAIAFENSYRHELEWQAVMYGLSEKEQEVFLEEHAGDPVLPMGPWHHYRPGGLYETMVRPLEGFGVRGILWYQGESDTGHPEIYDQTMQALVRCFRDTFRDSSLPFLFVQLAPFGHWLECGNDGYAALRAAQEKAASIIDNAWMASIPDLGQYEDIHPKFKKEVGRRLALLALGHVYGRDILCDPPACRKATLVDPGVPGCMTVRLDFIHAGEGLLVPANRNPAEGLNLLRDGKPLRIRKVRFDEVSIFVTAEDGTLHVSDGHPALLQVTCGWGDYAPVYILNSEGLCVMPFCITVTA